ncbi:unnamed protein product [Pleuronectes platessa]|uniref:Uncharacterized protein n=1 Tax=Pleuronectes platessa TaxID=8262 RepID=A0A9N7Z4K6_PLEPL|nr:unnamed protein product [Pleuronectes platessa]
MTPSCLASSPLNFPPQIEDVHSSPEVGERSARRREARGPGSPRHHILSLCHNKWEPLPLSWMMVSEQWRERRSRWDDGNERKLWSDAQLTPSWWRRRDEPGLGQAGISPMERRAAALPPLYHRCSLYVTSACRRRFDLTLALIVVETKRPGEGANLAGEVSSSVEVVNVQPTSRDDLAADRMTRNRCF